MTSKERREPMSDRNFSPEIPLTDIPFEAKVTPKEYVKGGLAEYLESRMELDSDALFDERKKEWNADVQGLEFWLDGIEMENTDFKVVVRESNRIPTAMMNDEMLENMKIPEDGDLTKLGRSEKLLLLATTEAQLSKIRGAAPDAYASLHGKVDRSIRALRREQRQILGVSSKAGEVVEKALSLFGSVDLKGLIPRGRMAVPTTVVVLGLALASCKADLEKSTPTPGTEVIATEVSNSGGEEFDIGDLVPVGFEEQIETPTTGIETPTAEGGEPTEEVPSGVVMWEAPDAENLSSQIESLTIPSVLQDEAKAIVDFYRTYEGGKYSGGSVEYYWNGEREDNARIVLVYRLSGGRVMWGIAPEGAGEELTRYPYYREDLPNYDDLVVRYEPLEGSENAVIGWDGNDEYPVPFNNWDSEAETYTGFVSVESGEWELVGGASEVIASWEGDFNVLKDLGPDNNPRVTDDGKAVVFTYEGTEYKHVFGGGENVESVRVEEFTKVDEATEEEGFWYNLVVGEEIQEDGSKMKVNYDFENEVYLPMLEDFTNFYDVVSEVNNRLEDVRPDLGMDWSLVESRPHITGLPTGVDTDNVYMEKKKLNLFAEDYFTVYVTDKGYVNLASFVYKDANGDVQRLYGAVSYSYDGIDEKTRLNGSNVDDIESFVPVGTYVTVSLGYELTVHNPSAVWPQWNIRDQILNDQEISAEELQEFESGINKGVSIYPIEVVFLAFTFQAE